MEAFAIPFARVTEEYNQLIRERINKLADDVIEEIWKKCHAFLFPSALFYFPFIGHDSTRRKIASLDKSFHELLN